MFWVGLPSIRGAKSTADTVYLNDLYRARAERAGVVYIDEGSPAVVGRSEHVVGHWYRWYPY